VVVNGSDNQHRADAPLDGVDVALLADIRAAYTELDPVPDGLADRVRFAIALENIDLEVLHLRAELAESVGARSEEISRTVTFDSSTLTIMIMLADVDGGQTVRIDGWLAPPAAHEIEVRTTDGSVVIQADGDGRFVAAEIPCGLCQLVVRVVEAGRSRLVVTPSIVL
jgi:hypothetical protein